MRSAASSSIVGERVGMSGKSIVLLDTAFSAMPIYDYLRSLDQDVFVIGGRPNDVLAKKAGSRWIAEDYSRVGAVREWLHAKRCETVVPGCTDVSLSVAAELAVSPYVDPKATIDVFGDKARFRALCGDLGLPTPAASGVKRFPASGLFIAKPADSFSGRGITVFDGQDLFAAEAAVATAQDVSPTGNVVIEDFIEGQLYSYSVFLRDRRPTVFFIVKEGSSANRFAVDTSLVVRTMPHRLVVKLASYATRIAESLDLLDGLLHIQFILRGEEIFLIEATRRCPGDLYALLIEYSTGYPYAAHYASSFLGLKFEAQFGRQCFVVRHTVTALLHSVNSGLRFTTPAGVRAFFPLQQMGDTLLPNQQARSGVLFLELPSEAQASETYKAFLTRSVYLE